MNRHRWTDAYALIKVFSQNYGLSRFNIVTNQSARRWSGRRLFEKLEKVTDAYLEVLLRHIGDIPEERLRRARDTTATGFCLLLPGEPPPAMP